MRAASAMGATSGDKRGAQGGGEGGTNECKVEASGGELRVAVQICIEDDVNTRCLTSERFWLLSSRGLDLRGSGRRIYLAPRGLSVAGSTVLARTNPYR